MKELPAVDLFQWISIFYYKWLCFRVAHFTLKRCRSWNEHVKKFNTRCFDLCSLISSCVLSSIGVWDFNFFKPLQDGKKKKKLAIFTAGRNLSNSASPLGWAAHKIQFLFSYFPSFSRSFAQGQTPTALRCHESPLPVPNWSPTSFICPGPLPFPSPCLEPWTTSIASWGPYQTWVSTAGISKPSFAPFFCLEIKQEALHWYSPSLQSDSVDFRGDTPRTALSVSLVFARGLSWSKASVSKMCDVQVISSLWCKCWCMEDLSQAKTLCLPLGQWKMYHWLMAAEKEEYDIWNLSARWEIWPLSPFPSLSWK